MFAAIPGNPGRGFYLKFALNVNHIIGINWRKRKPEKTAYTLCCAVYTQIMFMLIDLTTMNKKEQ